MEKTPFTTKEKLEGIAAKYPTPFHIQDEAGIRRNAENLKTATIETAREGERGIVDIETLQATNQTLISTLDEVLKIQDEGREKRRNAEAELQKIEKEMREKLLEISSKSKS